MHWDSDVIGGTPTHDRHGGRIDTGTGRPRLSFADAVEELTGATGARLRYMRVSSEHCVALLAAREVPDGVVAGLTRVIDELFETATLPTG
jgi:uncharacterized protein YbjT (DUF2867 family)